MDTDAWRRMHPGHLPALERQRRIVMHEDGDMPSEALGMDMDRWIELRFDHVDMPGSQIDAVWWDVGLAEDTYALFDSNTLPRLDHPGLRKWWDKGIDWVGELVRATKSRGLECFWHNRVCPVDFPQPFPDDPVPHEHPSRRNPLKQAHPDWVIPCWWPQGLWNLASEGCRRHKTAVLHEIVTKYEVDGIQLDFARHTPCLPQGREWELRDEATAFVRGVRTMLREGEQALDRPLLLAARVPENERGCRADGFDVRTWVEEGLVDIFTPGGRTIDVDLDWYRSFTRSTPVRLCCSFDGHHTTDGYFSPPPEYYRGVYANFWARGADSVGIFNWACARPDVYERHGFTGMMPIQGQSQSLTEIGSAATLRGKDKTFTVERRGGYPWAGNYHYRNDDRPLPATLPAGKELTLGLHVHDAPLAGMSAPHLTLRAVLRGVAAAEPPLASLNGVPLEPCDLDRDWKDGQIYGDGPQSSSGAWTSYAVRPEQKLLRVDYSVPPRALGTGRNDVRIGLREARSAAVVEKVELHVRNG